jgi:glucose/arabinose dehydrogenase
MRFTVLLSAVALCTIAARGEDPKLPPPFHSPSVRNPPKVIPRPDGATLAVPKGFKIEEFAGDFNIPRYMILGPSKEILVTDSIKDGAVYVLTNSGKDRKELVGKLNRPFGLAFYKDWLYIAETTSVKRYKYDAKTMTAGPGEEVVNMKDFDKGHWTRCLQFDEKAGKFYLGIGSASNVSTGEPEMRAAIHRFNADGTGHEVIAQGTRNPTSIHFYPGTATLWAAVQERDELGDDLVPDYFTAIKPGGFYGWPYAYIGPNEDPRNKGQREDLVKQTVVPDLVLGAHVAVIDFLFYTGKQFPKEYHGGAFLAFHGSWNRADRVGQTVAFVPFKNGKPVGEIHEFLSGWMLGKDKKEVWGRPVALLQLPDGSILVTDDGGKKIWRISYKG